MGATVPDERTLDDWCPAAQELTTTLSGYWSPGGLLALMSDVARAPSEVPEPAADLLRNASAGLLSAVHEFEAAGGDVNSVLQDGVHSSAAGPLTAWFNTYFEAGAEQWLEGNNAMLHFVAESCETRPHESTEPFEFAPPGSLDFGSTTCTAMNRDAVEEWLGTSVEVIDLADLLEEYDLDNEHGEYSCLMKQAGGDDQAPGVTLQVSADQDQHDVLRGLEDKAYAVQAACELLPDTHGLHVNRCTGGLGGVDSEVYNVWTFVDGASVLCGGGRPGVDLDAVLEICLPFISNLG